MDRWTKMRDAETARVSTVEDHDLDALYKRRHRILDVGPYNCEACAVMLRSVPVDPRRSAQHAHALQSRR